MGDLLKKAASPEVLNLAWKRLKNDKTIWNVGVSKKEMEKNFVFHITKLGLTLNSQKTHIVPSSPRVVFLGRKLPGKKRSGK